MENIEKIANNNNLGSVSKFKIGLYWSFVILQIRHLLTYLCVCLHQTGQIEQKFPIGWSNVTQKYQTQSVSPGTLRGKNWEEVSYDFLSGLCVGLLPTHYL